MTLPELMIAIAIFFVLVTLAIGGWRAIESRSRIEAALEGLRSAMALARIRAQTTGEDQLVYVDFQRDRYCTTAWKGADCATSGGTGWRLAPKGADLLGATSTCRANKRSGVRIYRFTARGTMQLDQGGPSYSVMARDVRTKKERCLVVTSVTGRVRLTQ